MIQNKIMSTSTKTDSNTATDTKSRFPVVEFEYPDSETQKMKSRYLRIVEADADHIKGYELDSPWSQKDGQFKTFSRNRLVKNGVSLISF